MSLTNQAEDDILDLQFTNVDSPNYGDAAGLQNSLVAGSIQVSLHTAALLDTHTLTTQFESAYTNYARQTVARSAAGWTVAAGTVDNDAAITYPQSGSSETVTDFGLTFMATGDFLQFFGLLTASLSITSGVTPEFAIGVLDISVD